MTKEEMREEVTNWVQDMESFYAEIYNWGKAFRPDEVLPFSPFEVSLDQAPLLKHFRLDDVKLPAFSLNWANNRISFEPSEFMVGGVRSVLFVVVSHGACYDLIQLPNETTRKLEWKLCRSQTQQRPMAFNEMALQKLMVEAEQAALSREQLGVRVG